MSASLLRFAFTAIFLICSGCTYRFRPVQLTVLQQSDPAVNVPVNVTYGLEWLPLPWPVEGTTDENGHVILSMADFTQGIILIDLPEKGESGPWGFIDPKQLETGGWASPQKGSDTNYRVQITPVGPWRRHWYDWKGEEQVSGN